MRFIALLVAVLAGIALLLGLDTGSLNAQEVTGIAIIALVVAGVVPSKWPWA